MEDNRQAAKTTNRITEGPIGREMLRFFFPLLMGTLCQQLYNTADAIIVGRFVGKEALAAVGGSSAVVVNLFINFFTGLSSGATVVISQFFGADRIKEAKRALHTSVALALAVGLCFTLIGAAAAGAAVDALGTPAEIRRDSALYLQIFFLGMIPAALYNMGSAVLRAIGDSRRPFYVLIVCCITNIALDLLFVVGFQLGVPGVAAATSLSQAVSAGCILFFLRREDPAWRLEWRSVRFHGGMLRRILGVGIPAGVQTSMYSISNLLIQSAINALGTDTVSAWAAYGKIDVVYWMTIGSFCVCVTTFVGQNYGAGRTDRVRASIRYGFLFSFAASALIIAGFQLFGTDLLRLFTSDASVLGIGTQIIRLLVPFFAVYVFVDILSGALRGLGDSVVPMVITLCGVCVLRVLWVLLVVPRSHTLTTVLVSYPVTWSMTAVLFLLYASRRLKTIV